MESGVRVRGRLGRVIWVLVVVVLAACSNGNSGSSEHSESSRSSEPAVVEPVVSLTLGAPTANPVVVPPSVGATSVRLSSVVRGTFYPEQLILDEVDSRGAVVQRNVATLRDDGGNEDTQRGDRTYTGQLIVDSAAAAEKSYRVRVSHDETEFTSGVGHIWISGCPSVARPSNPEKAAFDPQLGASIFVDEALVTLEAEIPPDLTKINGILADANAQVAGCIPALGQYLVEVPANTTVEDLYTTLDTLLDKPEIIAATPNAQVLDLPGNAAMDCDGLDCQWYLERIRAPQAWSIAGGGDAQVGVAVIDFGVDCNHPELDCDGSVHAEDIIDHGTGVAGLIGSRNREGSNMVGVAWNTALHPYSFIGRGGSQYKMSELITLSMAQDSVRVINISAATAIDPGNQVRDAMCSAIDTGRLLVAAAGNAATGNNCEIENIYPARYNTEGQCDNGVDLASGLLVVGATDRQNNLAQWEDDQLCSNTLHVDVYAPGKDIVTASGRDGYAAKDGTSYATPLVAGGAAVLWAALPDLSVSEVHDRLVNDAAFFTRGGEARTQTSDTRLNDKALLDLFSAIAGHDPIPTPNVNPDSFTLEAVTDAERNTFVTSAPIGVTGIDLGVPIAIEGGFYSIDDGPFTRNAGMVQTNQSVVVQLKSASLPDTVREATLSIGDQSGVFSVRTAAAVNTPDNFEFIAVDNAPLNSQVISSPVRISELSMATPIRIEGGEFDIDGQGFTAADSTVNADQDILIRVVSAATPETSTSALITIGDVSRTFQVTTERAKVAPTPFHLSPQDNVALSTQVRSNSVVVEGINTPVAISVSGGQYAIDGGPWRKDAGRIEAGQSVQIQHTSANRFNADTYSTLTVGSYSATLRSRSVMNTAPVATDLAIAHDREGDPQVGDTLLAAYTYSDAEDDPEGNSAFQWLRNDEAIEGATTADYVTTEEDIGQDLSFEITPMASSGTAVGERVTSASVRVVSSAPTATNVLIINEAGSSFLVGDTLVGSYQYQSLSDDAEGESIYRWLRNDIAIEGANGVSYTITADDVEQSLTFEVCPMALGGEHACVATVSNPITVGNSVPLATDVHIVNNESGDSGSADIGDLLTGQYTYSDVDGDLEGATSFRWIRNETEEVGTEQSYTVDVEDNGQSLHVEVTPRAATGSPLGAVVASAAVSVSLNAAPVATEVRILDVVEGVVGDVLSGAYTYEDADEDPEATSRYRWLRDGAAISGATATTYTLSAADIGQEIRFEVTPVAASGVPAGVPVRSSSTSVAEMDTTPDHFAFSPFNDVELNALTTSEAVVITGINTSSPISVSSGEYRINEGEFLTEAGVVSNGDSVQVRLTSSPEFNTVNRVTLDVGGVTATFDVTTRASSIPVFVSSESVNVPEGTLATGYVAEAVNDSGANIQYAISGGSDGDLFTIDRSTGALSFLTAPDFLDPSDNTGDNMYNVEITAQSEGYPELTTLMLTLTVIKVPDLQLAITFPTPSADLMGSENEITVSGSIVDADGEAVRPDDIFFIAVNGELATMDDADPSRWSVVTPISGGYGTIEAEVHFVGGGSHAVQQSIGNNAPLRNSRSMVLDGATLYVIDQSAGVVAINIADGSSTVVSNNYQVGEGPAFVRPYAIALDAANNRVFVSNDSSQSGRVLSVDLSTGDRAVIVPSTGITTPNGLVFDAQNNRLFGRYSKSVVSFDVESGEMTTVSGEGVGEGTPFSQLRQIAYDSDNNRIIVLDEIRRRLTSVDVATGDRSDINAQQLSGNSTAIGLDLERNRVLLGQSSYSGSPDSWGLLAVNMADGSVSTVSNIDSGSGPVADNTSSIVVDSTNNRALTLDSIEGVVLSTNLATGERETAASNVVGEGPLLATTYLDLDSAQNRIVAAVNRDHQSAVFSVDLTAGERSIISGQGTGAGQPLGGIGAIALDPDSNIAYVLDHAALGQRELIAIDLTNGERSVISGDTRGSGPNFNSGGHLVLDAANDRAFTSHLRSLIEVDLITGNRNFISNQDSGIGSGFLLNQINGLAYDGENGRVLVTDFINRVLVAIELESGDRSVLSDSEQGNGPGFSNPRGISFVPGGDQAYVHDRTEGLLLVDLVTGDRSVIASFSLGKGPTLSSAVGGDLACDFSRRRCFLGSLVIDIDSGDRAVYSQIR